MEAFIASTADYIHTSPWLAIAAVFVAGVVTASAPCVLAMVPLTMGFVAGRRADDSGALRAFGFSFVFVAGLATTFTALGMFAALAGELYGETSQLWAYLVAVLCIVMGLHMAEVIHVPIPSLPGFRPRIRGLLGAFFLGLLFGVVSAPCAAPVLIVLLAYLAGSDSSVAYGGLLLLTYALGHSVLILVAGTSMGAARALIESKRMTRATDLLRRGAGVVVILIGLFFVYQGVTN